MHMNFILMMLVQFSLNQLLYSFENMKLKLQSMRQIIFAWQPASGLKLCDNLHVLVFAGAFLIPYVLMLVLGGVPLMYLELIIGQFHRRGAISVWKNISPVFKGTTPFFQIFCFGKYYGYITLMILVTEIFHITSSYNISSNLNKEQLDIKLMRDTCSLSYG